MTCYVANHQKKLRALARRELELIRALQRGACDAKVLRAAEEVRDARVRVLFVQQSRIPSCENHESRFRRTEEAITACRATPISEIVHEFRARAALG